MQSAVEPDSVEWTSAERESFFAAIARHRRDAWRVTLASALANALVAFVVAALMAPLFYAAIALAFDAANVVRPVPNLVAIIGHEIGPAFDAPEKVPISHWLYLLLLAALPGLLWMTGVVLVLSRAMRVSGLFGDGDLAARPPNPQVLAEQRFGNAVSEMAVAANLPQPRVMIADESGMNGAVFGRDEGHATLVASRGLLEALDREQMQGVAAHLVGSIANGDMAIGVRVATTLGLFGLIGRMAGVFTEGRVARRLIRRLVLAVLKPTASGVRGLMQEISDPFAPERDTSATPRATHSRNDWRTMLWMPLAGPIAMTGFFGGLVNLFLLEPLVSLAWRQRKYMADAVAVRLTRQPDALAGALEKMASGAAALFGPWAAHLLVVRASSGGGGVMAASIVPPFPSIDRRLRALANMGAHLRSAPRRMPLAALLILVPLFALVGVLVCVVLYLLVIVSVALSVLFLGLPFSVVHMLLRWAGH